MPGCAVGEVDRLEVQVSAIIFSPSMNFLRFSKLFVILSSEHDGIVTVPSCSSLGIFCFPMVFLPLSFAVSFTSRVIHSCKEVRNYHSLKSGFDSLYVFLIRSKTNATSAEDQSLWYVLQAKLALNGSGYLSTSCNSMLPSS